MGKGLWGKVFMTVGLLWGAIGFVIWVSYVPTGVRFLDPEPVQYLIFFVIGPALLFIFTSIISAITNVHSNI